MLTEEIKAGLSPAQPSDEYYMMLAVEVAKKGLYLTRPNPSVGCVIVKAGQVVGIGTTAKVGGSHAEVFALAQAGIQAQGATAYVTLEPCSHTGRTPPCCDALIQPGIARVVIAVIDPNPKVSGEGIKRLLAASVAVTILSGIAQAYAINAGFLKAMATKLPFVRLKLGISLDGKIAMKSGESKWITGSEARQDVQKLRARSAAIITGSQTILDDNPALTVRECVLGVPIADIPTPKSVVVDRRGRLALGDAYQVTQRADTLLWQGELLPLLQTLVKEFLCYDVLVEAGAQLASAFITAGLVDELIVYQAPCLLGADANSMFVGHFTHLSEQVRLQLISCERLGEDIKLRFALPSSYPQPYKDYLTSTI